MGPVAAAIAPPRELTAVAPQFAALANDLTDRIREAFAGNPVQDHMANGQLAVGRLAAGLEIDVLRKAGGFFAEVDLREGNGGAATPQPATTVALAERLFANLAQNPVTGSAPVELQR